MIRAAIISLGLVSLSGVATADGDAARGEQVFRKCASCHMVGAEARNRAGPPLNNIIGAKAGQAGDFKYSKGLLAAAQDGLHWDADTLDAFLADPKTVVPKSRMNFRGLRTPQDRTDVIAYLASFGGGELATVMDEGFAVAPEVLAIEGDYAWGEYLSSECTTCHQASGANDGIPSITGWDTDPFVTAMHAYREKHRENPVMQLIAGRLSDDEIAGLAAYFKELE